MDLDEEFKEVESSKEILNKFCIDSLSNDRTFCVTDNNEIVVYKANQDDDSIEKLSSMPIKIYALATGYYINLKIICYY
jgi:hypothetical protein